MQLTTKLYYIQTNNRRQYKSSLLIYRYQNKLLLQIMQISTVKDVTKVLREKMSEGTKCLMLMRLY
jgi:hypothetical protein